MMLHYRKLLKVLLITGKVQQWLKILVVSSTLVRGTYFNIRGRIDLGEMFHKCHHEQVFSVSVIVECQDVHV